LASLLCARVSSSHPPSLPFLVTLTFADTSLAALPPLHPDLTTLTQPYFGGPNLHEAFGEVVWPFTTCCSSGRRRVDTPYPSMPLTLSTASRVGSSRAHYAIQLIPHHLHIHVRSQTIKHVTLARSHTRTHSHSPLHNTCSLIRTTALHCPHIAYVHAKMDLLGPALHTLILAH